MWYVTEILSSTALRRQVWSRHMANLLKWRGEVSRGWVIVDPSAAIVNQRLVGW